jgi:glycosyltransferase involved in cell wall biosynthesis
VGGAERTLSTGIPALIAAGLQVELIVLDAASGNNPFLAALDASGVRYHVVPDLGRPSLRRLLGLRKLLRSIGAACLHAHGYRAVWYGAFLSKSLGIPVLATRHGVLSRHLRERWVEMAERETMRVFDAVVCVAPHLSEGVQAPVSIIENAVALPKEESIRWPADEPTRLLYVGRLSQEKNLLFLLRALAPLFRERDQLVLEIVGEGSERETLERFVWSQGLASRVFFQGFQSEPSSFYREADCVLLASLREGLPLVVLEAMAAGKPVVSTAVGAVPTLLEGETPRGCVVPLHNERAYTEAVAAILDEPGLARRWGMHARRYVEQRYSLARWAEAHSELYETVCGQMRKRHAC